MLINHSTANFLATHLSLLVKHAGKNVQDVKPVPILATRFTVIADLVKSAVKLFENLATAVKPLVNIRVGRSARFLRKIFRLPNQDGFHAERSVVILSKDADMVVHGYVMKGIVKKCAR